MSVHTIAKGESLGKVAGKYGITVKAILGANPAITNPDRIQIGQRLQIPSTAGKTSGVAGVSSTATGAVSSVAAKNTKSQVGEEAVDEELLYSIKPGDTLGRVAALHGLSLEELLKANPAIKSPDRVFVGQKILIPKKTGKKSADPMRTAAGRGAGAGAGFGAITGALGALGGRVKPAGPASAPSSGSKTGKGRKPAKNLNISDKGVKFIASYEGYEPNLYNDAANHCTIGYGHLLHFGPCNELDKKSYPNGVNKSQSLALLKKDAQTAVKGVRRSVKVDLNQGEFDALVSWTFNLGEGNLKSSTMLKKLNKGEYAEIPKEMNRWTKAGGKKLKGLVKRRKAEGDMFSKGVYNNH